MDPLDYSFGTGVGTPTTWTSLADLSVGAVGSLDAVALDFDGDGWRDDAMWDFDGDTVADHSVLDVGDEARYFTDPSGEGTWNQEVPCPEKVSPEMQQPDIAPPETIRPDTVHPDTAQPGTTAYPAGLDVRTVSAEPILLSTGNVSRPISVVDSGPSSAVDGDGDQAGGIDGGPAQRQAH